MRGTVAKQLRIVAERISAGMESSMTHIPRKKYVIKDRLELDGKTVQEFIVTQRMWGFGTKRIYKDLKRGYKDV